MTQSNGPLIDLDLVARVNRLLAQAPLSSGGEIPLPIDWLVFWSLKVRVEQVIRTFGFERLLTPALPPASNRSVWLLEITPGDVITIPRSERPLDPLADVDISDDALVVRIVQTGVHNGVLLTNDEVHDLRRLRSAYRMWLVVREMRSS
jgi:hypothetical protein